ncbi:secretin and TonB N terminus short domain protein [Janthinobacterium sp. SUN118]|uniref:secretin and TonB N-terminal domain-containing protein n=1 Tax=Janthinobacterium sp. SUN118 TaxID=3004100 RepID=UPI0025B277DE|nr:secretin and TonB N-terminal domain-containing protein [Janthinobacterium sp. SUN118]MDN2713087.1 secretin and TonB N terminus short domain protein [Janthinobacterium sp. SUN118]
MTRTHRRTATGNALALSACLLMTLMTFVRPAAGADGSDAGAQASVRFDLPAQPLDAALVAFGEITGYSVLVSSDLAAGRMAAPVRGDYTPVEALQRLLVGTQLGVRFSGSNAFTLLALPAAAPAAPPLPEAAPAGLALQAYAAVLQRSLTRALCRLHPDAFGRYRLAFQLWLDERGKVRAVHVLEASGVAQRDRAVLQRLRSLLMDGAPPANLPQPLTILLTPRPDPDADCAPYLSLAGAS